MCHRVMNAGKLRYYCVICAVVSLAWKISLVVGGSLFLATLRDFPIFSLLFDYICLLIGYFWLSRLTVAGQKSRRILNRRICFYIPLILLIATGAVLGLLSCAWLLCAEVRFHVEIFSHGFKNLSRQRFLS
ncbi:hypothetical protein BJX66DRAFT_317476 [Aspergillus keveii]|uniref:Uncharacterized protein n=1 Tax=Aspergillus keveii TaxID=714993 RepID=A0ABR4FL46_9EURO